jgi:hypothetical protein
MRTNLPARPLLGCRALRGLPQGASTVISLKSKTTMRTHMAQSVQRCVSH